MENRLAVYYSQTCMVKAPSKNQFKRAPMSFTLSSKSLVHYNAGSTLERTIGPTLIEISYPRVVSVGK